MTGHSFVSGLRDHFRSRYENTLLNDIPLEGFVASQLRIDHHVQEVHLLGQSGAVASDFLLPHNFVTPDIVLIELGTNDIAQGMGGTEAADIIFELSQNLSLSYKCVVIVLSVLPRVSSLGCEVSVFDRERSVLETALKGKVSGCKEIKYFKHKGFWAREIQGQKFPIDIWEWSRDGVHPNSVLGRHKYKVSVWAAILEALKLRTTLISSGFFTK